MSATSTADVLLIRRIRAGEAVAWDELIARFEGRLTSFVEGRVRDRSSAEDIVQETFVGFLTSLPNYDESRALEGYLFTIAAHKLTDHLRRSGRRPAISLASAAESGGDVEPQARGRLASSLARSGERCALEESAVAKALAEIIDRWRSKGDWDRVRLAELLFVRGVGNKDAAAKLGLTEQQVANQKFDFIERLRREVSRLGLPEEVFPELAESAGK